MKYMYLSVIGFTFATGIFTATGGDRSVGDKLPRFLEQFDTNGDGLFDEEERQAIKDARAAKRAEWIAQWDTDRSGDLSSEELEAIRQSIRERIETRRAERFNELAGEDGSLSLDEFSAIPGISLLSEERVQALFHRMDADQSGGVSLDEFNARLRPHGRSNNGGIERPEPPDFGNLLERFRERFGRPGQ